MSRKMTSKCDGCGVEVVEDDDMNVPFGVLGAMQRLRRGSENWGSLRVPVGTFPVSFDLCDACTKRVVDLLELTLPKLGTLQRGLGGHAMPFMPGDFMAPPSGPPWSTPMGPPFGGLTPEDLKQLGIELPPNLTSVPMSTPSSTCSNCGVGYKGAKPAICMVCGQAA